MSACIDVPELTFVRALTDGGPYRAGDVLSLAFVDPRAGRIATHEAGHRTAPVTRTEGLPETISASVMHAAGPYRIDDVVTLSFLDPALARIHATETNRAALTATNASERAFAAAPVRAPAIVAAPPATETLQPEIAVPDAGVRLTLTWTADRVRRFVQVTDKLFTVDRLGWYRHVFAMRLLLPDSISCGRAGANDLAAEHLRALRSAALETLGRPLLASFMPSFTVSPQWLDAIDGAQAARALAGLRGVIAPFAIEGGGTISRDDESTTGTIGASELAAAPATSMEAMLPLLIAPVSRFDDVTAVLGGYRASLVELFAQAAGSAENVRLGTMAAPNHTLDDGLWRLVGVISERFGGLAVA